MYSLVFSRTIYWILPSRDFLCRDSTIESPNADFLTVRQRLHRNMVSHLTVDFGASKKCDFCNASVISRENHKALGISRDLESSFNEWLPDDDWINTGCPGIWEQLEWKSKTLHSPISIQVPPHYDTTMARISIHRNKIRSLHTTVSRDVLNDMMPGKKLSFRSICQVALYLIIATLAMTSSAEIDIVRPWLELRQVSGGSGVRV